MRPIGAAIAWIVAGLLGMGYPSLAAPAESSVSPFSLHETTLNVSPTAGGFSGYLVVKGTGLNCQPAQFRARDPFAKDPPGFEISFTPTEQVVSVGPTYWFFLKATGKGLPGSGDMQRKLVLECQTIQDVLSYTLSPAKGTLSLDITAGPKKMFLPMDPSVSLAVTLNGNLPVTNVRLADAALTDSSGRTLGLQFLRLCSKTSGGSCSSTDPIALQPGELTTLYLSIDNAFQGTGLFKGNLWIAADGMSPKPVPWEVSSATAHARAWGAWWLLFGLATGWFVMYYARTSIMIDSALLWVAELRSTLDGLEQRIDLIVKKVGDQHLPKGLPKVKAYIASITLLLADEQIRRRLPRRWNPFHAVTAADLNEVKSYLVEPGNFTDIAAVVASGMGKAFAYWDPAKPNPVVVQALTKLDDVPASATTVGAARTQVEKILGELHLDLALVADGMAEWARTADLPTRTTLEARLAAISALVWLIWAGFTLASGWVVVIAGNPDFGANGAFDYLKCALWGLGVQITGVGALTPTTATGAMKIDVPKTS